MSFVRTQWRVIFTLFIFVTFVFLFQIIVSYVFVYKTSIQNIEDGLETMIERIEKDLAYVNGKWNTTLYNADPLTPYPNGSSGFANPLYIVTSEGFIIERSQPISGFLDTSDFNHLITFQTPQTINTVTNESWRVLSQPIVDGVSTVGVVILSYYNPQQGRAEEIDQKMRESVESIIQSLQVKDHRIDTHRIDIRNIHYEYSFEIVDKYNNVLLNNGRVPTYIDPSYFAKEIESKKKRTIVDAKTGKEFFIVSKTLTSNKLPIGIIIAGEPIDTLNSTLQKYVYFSSSLGFLVTIPLMIYTVFVMRKFAHKSEEEGDDGTKINSIKKIQFDKKASVLWIDEKQYPIPYASYQYYICIALVLQPNKQWEYDQLLEVLGDFGEQINTRKVYDAVHAINKRINFRLIEYKNKTFSINSQIRSLVSKH
ncbi:MAG: hypothetical protein WAV30_03255 [Microgenomates group bacterium]